MPTAQSILTHSPDLAAIEAVTTPVESEVVVVGIAAGADPGDGDGGSDAAPVVVEALQLPLHGIAELAQRCDVDRACCGI